MKLTVKQRKFADLYLEYGNATKAAIEAGYKPDNAGNNADKLLKNTKIKSYIEERLEEIESQKIADITEIMQYLTKGLRQELEEEVVVVEGIDKGVSEAKIVTKKISLRDSNKCAELLAKRYGILSESLDVNLSVPVFGGEDELED
jgi:phage terminase small subunit